MLYNFECCQQIHCSSSLITLTRLLINLLILRNNNVSIIRSCNKLYGLRMGKMFKLLKVASMFVEKKYAQI